MQARGQDPGQAGDVRQEVRGRDRHAPAVLLRRNHAVREQRPAPGQRCPETPRHARTPISLDQAVGDEGDSELGDFVEDSEAVVAMDVVAFSLLQAQLQQVLGTLSDREAGVIRLRFGLADGRPRTLGEIGDVYGVTRERIRQIESKTMCKLRHPARSEALRDYLD